MKQVDSVHADLLDRVLLNIGPGCFTFRIVGTWLQLFLLLNKLLPIAEIKKQKYELSYPSKFIPMLWNYLK
jgi:hypothetical protein